MVLILGYNKSETEYLNKIFLKNNIEFKYSLLESHILKADKIILPHPLNFNSTYRRMNMSNLFSMLRIVDKPILGINNGFRLMCNQLLNNSKCGLGFFNIDVGVHENDLNNSNLDSGEIRIDKSCKLVKSLKEKSVNFNSELQQESFECSKIIISSKNKNYSLLHETKNFYGLELDIEKNQGISEEIITKFIEL